MKLYIDAGHGQDSQKRGRYDPGAVGPKGEEEASEALLWALTLRHACVNLGLKVDMSRVSNNDRAPLGERVAEALAGDCTHFISLHLNHSEDAQANGTETIYHAESSKPFARLVQTILVKSLGLRDRGVKHDEHELGRRLAVLRFPGTCALIELGFISNARDRAAMDTHREKTCEALAEFFSRL